MPFRKYRDLEPREFIVCGYDLSMGGEDYSACVFLSKTRKDIPLIYHAKETATISTNNILPSLESIYKQTGVRPVIAPERNSGGVFEVDRMLNSSYKSFFRMYVAKNIGSIENSKPTKYGWDTNTATRPKMLEELKNAIDNRLIGVYDEILIEELYSFIIGKTLSSWKAQAESGAHDDLVMALAIAWQLYQTEVSDEEYSDGEFESLEHLFDKEGFY